MVVSLSEAVPHEKHEIREGLEMPRIGRTGLRVVWLLLLGISLSYFLLVYFIPIAGLSDSPPLPMKAVLETALYASAIIVSVSAAMAEFRDDEIVLDVDDDVFYVVFPGKVVGTSCFDIKSVGPSLNRMPDGTVSYNTAFLLALRNGMAERVSMAYEVGVNAGEPFLRLFMTTSRSSLRELHETLAREATRAEAILLSSLPNVELTLLRNKSLRDVCLCTGDSVDVCDRADSRIEGGKSTLSIKGNPRVSIAQQSSQIGTFLSTALRQGLNLTLTCVFSPTDAGREKRRMESKWNSIRLKEKRKEDSLADQTAKQSLIVEYQKTQMGDAWFNVSVYVTLREHDPARCAYSQEGVKGLILSTWGGEEPISLSSKNRCGRSFYRMSTRRHLECQKLHVSRLAAFVNTPFQNIPVVSVAPAPTFTIPSREMVENELSVGWAVYGGRRLHRVGLKTEWLREHVAVLGATGTGKTTLVKRLIAELSKLTETPWWIFDLKGSEYSDLARVVEGNAIVLRPGLDPYFVIDFLDPESGSDANTTFTILRELLMERGASSELSPAMERLLRDALFSMTESDSRDFSVAALLRSVEKISERDRVGLLTRDALLNRLEILKREPLGSILAGGEGALSISALLDKRVIFDLRHVARTGGMDAARVLYNLVAKRIFEASMKRGIREGLHHVVVLEEASNLVPESYTRTSAADVTTGESMVMLQRATGQGVIVVSTRPNISSNILANTATKFTFRLPYDSSAGAKYMSLDSEQERYLRSLKLGRALVSMPGIESFEIATAPFKDAECLPGPKTAAVVVTEKDSSSDEKKCSISASMTTGASAEDSDGVCETPDVRMPKRTGDVINQIIALLASKGVAIEEDLYSLISAVEPKLAKERASELLEDLVSRSSIEREALPLVPGGLIFTLPGNGLDGVRNVIAEYIIHGTEFDGEVYREDLDSGWTSLLLGDNAVLIVPEQLRASSLQPLVESIREHMRRFGNAILRYSVVIRGSVAAAKLREMMDKSDEFDAVDVVSAFPASLDRLIQDLNHGTGGRQTGPTEIETSEKAESPEEGLLEPQLDLHAREENQVRSSSQKRLWFGLIQDFINLQHGCIRWSGMLEFIETTASQSLRSRAAPLNTQMGRDALTELLGDEALVAVRVGDDNRSTGLDTGLWIVNTPVLKGLKDRVLKSLEEELVKKHGRVRKNHEYYDICVEDASYLVFPTQQQLNTLLRLHSDIACRSCGSRRVVCLLTAAEYMDDTVTGPENLMLKTLDEGLSAVVA